MKKIENPLIEGLPSKIYLRAFSAPKSRYQIAKEIYDIPKGQIPPTAKVSNAVNNMLSEKYGKKYLIETPDGVLSDVAPLVAEIEKDLENRKIKLTFAEKSELTNFLDKQFRALVADTAPPAEGDVNAYYNLKNHISTIAFMKRRFTSINLDDLEFEKLFKNFLPNDEERYNEFKEVWKELKEMPLSNSLLEKLETLAPEEITTSFDLAFGVGRIFVEGIERMAETSRKENQYNTQT